LNLVGSLRLTLTSFYTRAPHGGATGTIYLYDSIIDNVL
jgi:hypothetical protein